MVLLVWQGGTISEFFALNDMIIPGISILLSMFMTARSGIQKLESFLSRSTSLWVLGLNLTSLCMQYIHTNMISINRAFAISDVKELYFLELFIGRETAFFNKKLFICKIII